MRGRSKQTNKQENHMNVISKRKHIAGWGYERRVVAGGFKLDFEECTGLGRCRIRSLWLGQDVHKQAKTRC